MREKIPSECVFSECGKYRYRLKKVWREDLSVATWVMLNPSIANEQADDPTIRRCVSFSNKFGHGGLVVVNLFAMVATDPAELAKMFSRGVDIVGPKNDEVIAEATASEVVYLAWGANASTIRSFKVVEIAKNAGAELRCLGKTKEGMPRHPLYLPSQKAWEPF